MDCLDELKKEYEKHKKKYNLPEFTDLNKLFDIEDVSIDTEFLLRKIRRSVSEKVAGYLRFIEIILNPSNAPIFFFKLVKKLDNDDKEAFTKYAAPLIWEYDYIFYVSPVGVDIEDNGVRTTDADYRKLIDITIKGTISENLNKIKNLAFISGTTEERIKQVKSCLGF
jgi:hypothetical protein